MKRDDFEIRFIEHQIECAKERQSDYKRTLDYLSKQSQRMKCLIEITNEDISDLKKRLEALK